jgi:serine/threonine-protein kinase
VSDAASSLRERLAHALGERVALGRELPGGMSRVFVAHDRALDREVVVKVLPPELAATVSAERFRREILLVASLQHPNVVPVFSAGEVDGVPYFVMPFVQGESLRARLQRGPLSVGETVRVLRDVARALAVAHGRGIVHRDIKPDNILLASNAAVVADFGVARAISAARTDGRTPAAAAAGGTVTGVGISLGTPQYMAPEQAVADPSTDHRADLYALGIVGYEMLVGTPPYYGRAPQAVLAAHLTEPPPPVRARRADVPPMLADALAACLEKAPERRPRSAAHLLQLLEDVATELNAPPPRRTRPAHRARLLWAAGAAVGVLAVGGAWWQGTRAATPDPPDGWALDTAAARAAAAPPPARPLLVRPLSAVGGDPRAAAIAEGLTSDLTGTAGGLPGYRVAAAGIAAAGAAPSTPAADALVLEGTVQRDGATVRVQVRLLDGAAGAVVWSGSRTGPADSALALQDGVARDVIVALETARATPPR